MTTRLAPFILLLATGPLALAAPNDWAEGPGESNGATRDYYNRAGFLPWDNYMGDWWDENDVQQGDAAYAVTSVADTDSSRYEEWDVTTLVQEWVDDTWQNQGMFLRGVGGSGPINFRSREHGTASERPELVVTTSSGSVTLSPGADTYLEPSTYRSQGESDTMRVASGGNNALLRFDLSGFTPGETVLDATLRLFTFQQYGSTDIGVFRCAHGHGLPPSDPIPGLAQAFEQDQGIGADADVFLFADFESESWVDGWTHIGGTIDIVDSNPDRLFVPWQGKALRVLIPEGSTGALNVDFEFMDKVGFEPEEIWFRYYLRFGDDWNQTVQGGKLPGIAGTYGVAGWGGRPSDGTNGWSARGLFILTIPDGNPLSGTTPIGTYCYHADMPGQYGDNWHWQEDYRGFFRTNEWHAVEQYLKMNTPGDFDGVLRAWVDGRLAFEKTDIRFRTVDTLKIEEIWMNIYHGGTTPSPYDQHAYIDNVVIASRYIGPMNTGVADTTPPAAPTNLVVE